MTVYEKASPELHADIRDFINMVFSQQRVPHDFRALLPKVYGDGEVLPCTHYIAREEHRIRAVVGCLSYNLSVLGAPLRVGYVGSVSVHGDARGAGHMKRLMQDMLADQQAAGVDLFVLGGQRQRYQYFGFERAGANLRYSFNTANLRHAFGAYDIADWSFRPITLPQDPALDAAFALYEAQPLHGARPRGLFLTILQTWRRTVWAIEKAGDFQGYLTADAQGGIGECLLRSESDLPTALKAWMSARQLEELRFSAAPYEVQRNEILYALCEDVSVHGDSMIHVHSWDKMLSAFLGLKATGAPLPDSCRVVEIQGAGRYSIEMRGGAAQVLPTDAPADASFTGLEAITRFFSPVYGLLPNDPALAGIAPLPYALPSTDGF